MKSLNLKELSGDVVNLTGEHSQMNAFLDQGCEFEGKMTFEGTVRINGRFKGEIFSNDTLVIGEGAEVSADLDVNVLVLAGTLSGNVRARERIEMHAPAVMRGDLVSPSLIIHQGTLFDGNCQMSKES